MKPTRARLKKPMSPALQRYSASIAYDRRLAGYDIAGSIAHVRMLGRQGIIPKRDADQIVKGLEAIRREIVNGKFSFRDDLEDIHINIEARLTELIGDAAGKLHTGRSRNDQVALDMRLFVKDAATQTRKHLRDMQAALIAQAERHIETVMPGYTHLQRGQPVLLAHHLLAHARALDRDGGRLADCRRRADVMPLGSGAMAGSPYPFDREAVAKELGFSRVSLNSIDAVADRDFVIEYLSAASICMMHLSRLAEEIVLWTTSEFAFAELDDAYATGSSLMPQKKNADVAELARGKTGRVYGHLMAMLTTMKGLPLAYDRDMQEDKEGLFDAVDTMNATLEVLAEAVSTMRFDKKRMREAAAGGYVLATDVADYLVRKGVPFREAHGIVGEVVQYAAAKGIELGELKVAEYKKFSPKFDADVLKITFDTSVASRKVVGGTAPERVREALAEAKERLAAARE
ncbi:MAG: argininosuccinate lyase [Chloroflexi bacterium]|nr:argininosuccinate lyase [Chloroflexota bacterium]